MTNVAPSFETDRLVLRGHTVADFDDCAALWSDPVVTRHIGGRPSTREDAWSRLLRYAGHWTLLGFGYWVVREKSSGRFVGEVGFADFERDIEPPFDGAPEAGWVLAPWAHGKGLATEAVSGAIGWIGQRFGGVRTVCIIDPDNVASIRVAEKCGYVEFHRTTYKGGPAILFERLEQKH
jgi:RimJ/RimL family protein N-acetyltransferase